jgi:O-antigen/teichoic acid export membrane protein
MNTQRRGATVDMTAGKSLPLMLRFSLPILLGNLFQQLYTVVDGIVVGKNVSMGRWPPWAWASPSRTCSPPSFWG